MQGTTRAKRRAQRKSSRMLEVNEESVGVPSGNELPTVRCQKTRALKGMLLTLLVLINLMCDCGRSCSLVRLVRRQSLARNTTVEDGRAVYSASSAISLSLTSLVL